MRSLSPANASKTLDHTLLQRLYITTPHLIKVVKLASETFNYLRIDVEKSKAKKIVNEHFPKVTKDVIDNKDCPLAGNVY